MLCGCKYVLEYNLVCVRVCVHPSLIENKGLIQSGTMTHTKTYTRLMYTEHIHAHRDNGKTIYTSIR